MKTPQEREIKILEKKIAEQMAEIASLQEQRATFISCAFVFSVLFLASLVIISMLMI